MSNEQTNKLSAEAQQLLSFFEAEYIQSGYMYSGCLPPSLIRRKVFAGDEEASARAIDELRKAGIIEIRNCHAFKYELTAARRVALIEKHRLSSVWQQDFTASCFHPNSEHGEITNARRKSNLVERGLCPYCEGEGGAHKEGCTNPNAPNYCKRCEQVAEHCDAGHCLNCHTDEDGWPFYTDCEDCNLATGLSRLIAAA